MHRLEQHDRARGEEQFREAEASREEWPLQRMMHDAVENLQRVVGRLGAEENPRDADELERDEDLEAGQAAVQPTRQGTARRGDPGEQISAEEEGRVQQ